MPSSHSSARGLCSPSPQVFSWQLVTIRERERDACFRAFMNNNWVGFALFLGLFLHYIVAGAYSA